MKNIFLYTVLILSIILSSVTNSIAQAGKEIKLAIVNPESNMDTSSVAVSVIPGNAKNFNSKNGIHFQLSINNHADQPVYLKNFVDMMVVMLFNEHNQNVSILDMARFDLSKKNDSAWKFQSEAISIGKIYLDNKEKKYNLREMEYIDIPAHAHYKVNLFINEIKKVAPNDDMMQSYNRPTIPLPSGKYQLQLLLRILAKKENQSEVILIGNYKSPMIPINYKK